MDCRNFRRRNRVLPLLSPTYIGSQRCSNLARFLSAENHVISDTRNHLQWFYDEFRFHFLFCFRRYFISLFQIARKQESEFLSAFVLEFFCSSVLITVVSFRPVFALSM